MLPPAYFLYVACFVQGKGPGLAIYRMDATTAELTHVASPTTQAAPLQAAMFVETDPTNRFLYVADAVSEVDGIKGGAVAAFAHNAKSGALTFLNRVTSGGVTPCYVSVDPAGKYLLVANYTEGNIAMIAIRADGSLAPTPADLASHLGPGDKKANAHSILFDPAGRFSLGADLGVNRIFSYRPDRDGLKLTPAPNVSPLQTAANAGPRHLAFHPSGKFLYCQTEYDNTVIAMTYDAATGAAKIIQTESSLPKGWTATSYGADIAVHPSGRFLYSTNRGHESLAIFAIDGTTGRVTLVGHEPTQGVFPRDFTIDPSGTFLLVANERSDTIVSFRIDGETGKLSATGKTTKVASPSCLKLVPVAGE